MENKRYYSKENIKDRMFRNAAVFWGIRNIENLDPLVKLLIEAMASEVYKLSNEVANIETRVLERIAQLLTPDTLMSPRPAHAILHARPIEPETLLNCTNGFYYDDAVLKNRYKVNDIYFYPVQNVSLIDAQVKILASEKAIYTYDRTLNKDLFASSKKRVIGQEEQSIWIGLELNRSIKNIENLSFCFDFLNMDSKSNLFSLLPLAKWEFLSNIVNTEVGLFSPGKDNNSGNTLARYDLPNILDESVRNYYSHRFITVTDKLKISPSDKSTFPAELKDFYPADVIDSFSESLIWLRITFPVGFHSDPIDTITVSVNAFPVANKKICKESSRNHKMTNIVSLNTDYNEYFLSVLSVTDSRNREYKQLPYPDEKMARHGTYSLKRGGIERFDTRNVEEFVLQLLDLLRDESVSFSLLGKGFLNDLVNEIEALTITLEQKFKSIGNNRETPTYIIVDSEGKNEIFDSEYWVTNCEVANEIKSGSFFLQKSNEVLASPGAIFTLTTTTGGRSKPKSVNALDTYKYILTSRDRIYTTDDIINFCKSELKDTITTIEVKKGIHVSPKPKEGLIRTIDIIIQMEARQTLQIQEIKENLLNLLARKSPDTYNYRIFIN